MTDEDYMKEALLEAQKAFSRGDVPVGALLVKDGAIVSRGSDRKYSDPTEHAEIVAIRSFTERSGTWNLTGCTLYVTLEPCPMCAGACVISRVSKVVFGAKNYRSGAGGTLFNILNDSRLNHCCEVQEGVMENECVKILQDYFLQRRQSK